MLDYIRYVVDSSKLEELYALFERHATAGAVNAKGFLQILREIQLAGGEDLEVLQSVFLSFTPTTEAGWLTGAEFIPMLILLAEAKFYEIESSYKATVKLLEEYVFRRPIDT